MRRLALVLLPLLVALALPASAMAEARYPFCPPKVGDRTLTSTSERGDETYPQIVCWYEDKQPAYEFNAGWTTEAYDGFAGIGCGAKPINPKTRVNSLSHDAYVQTNNEFASMPGFEEAIRDFLHQLQTDFAQPCGAEKIRFNLTRSKQVVPAKSAAEHCGTKKGKPSCEIMDDAPVKVCNQTRKPQTLFSKSKGNKFGPTKVKPGKCLTRRFNNPSREEQAGSSLGGGASWIFIHLLLYPDSRVLFEP